MLALLCLAFDLAEGFVGLRNAFPGAPSRGLNFHMRFGFDSIMFYAPRIRKFARRVVKRVLKTHTHMLLCLGVFCSAFEKDDDKKRNNHDSFDFDKDRLARR